MNKKKILQAIPHFARYLYFASKAYLVKNYLLFNNHGKGAYCVICNNESSKFLSHRDRTNVVCVNCGSFDRDRLIYAFLKSETNILDSSIRLLHFAPEECLYRIFKKYDNITYHPADISPELYNYSLTKIERIDITKIPYPDNFFDMVLCNHVLEHVKNDIRAIKELRRVLKPSGWGILQVPIDLNRVETYEDSSIKKPHERKIHFGQEDHLRVYGRDYVNILEDNGFKVEVNSYVKKTKKDLQILYGFPPKENIYIVR